MPCLIDTNILIDALDPQIPAPIAARIVDAIADDARYSVIPTSSCSARVGTPRLRGKARNPCWPRSSRFRCHLRWRTPP